MRDSSSERGEASKTSVRAAAEVFLWSGLERVMSRSQIETR